MKIDNSYNYRYSYYKPNFKRNLKEHASWGAKYIKEVGKTNFKLFTFPDAKAVFVEIAEKAGKNFGNIKDRIVQILAAQGAVLTINKIFTKDDETKIYPMDNKGEGIFEANNIDTEENTQYRFVIVDKNNQVNIVKDPYSMKQSNINGWSEIYDSNNYEWKATDWLEGRDARRITRKPKEPLRGLENLVIEEINVPTLSEDGTFEKAKAHIDKIAENGFATAVEIMPVENTFSLQWGYDGVDKFAVNEKMGGAAKLKEFIDYAHTKGLNVIMDMVPNHMGPDGNYLTQTGPYIKKAGDFGDVLNYEGKDNKYVRDWMVNAALWWINEFKVDGLRLDMTKYCESDYLLKQIVCEVNEHYPKIFMIAEDGRENKRSVTEYEQYDMPHDIELEMIDQSVDNIANRKWHTYPNSVGFDSEWDFPLMHELKDSILNHELVNLDRLDDKIKNSKYRIKYVMSHDEIGNLDGTRLFPKIISKELNLFNRIDGYSDADKGQKAAHTAQKIAEMALLGEFKNKSEKEISSMLKKIGINHPEGIKEDTINTAFNIAFAKQKLAIGTIMTIPGPKMYFQGDDSLDLSYFKFFREFSSDEYNRKNNPNYIEGIKKDKGYDTIENIARKDSILNKYNLDENNNEQVRLFKNFIKNLGAKLNQEPIFTKGEIVNTYKDFQNKIHIHHLKYNNEEILVIKNFGANFIDSYSYSAFPAGEWEETLNSDCEEFGGLGYNNSSSTERMRFSPNKQALKLAPNSISILKKIN